MRSNLNNIPGQPFRRRVKFLVSIEYWMGMLETGIS